MAVDLAVFDGKALKIYDGFSQLGALFARLSTTLFSGETANNVLNIQGPEIIQISSDNHGAIIMGGLGESGAGRIRFFVQQDPNNPSSISRVIDLGINGSIPEIRFNLVGLISTEDSSSNTHDVIRWSYSDGFINIGETGWPTTVNIKAAVSADGDISTAGNISAVDGSFSGNLQVDGDLNLTGNLNISGEINQYNLNQLHIEDNAIILNSNLDSGTPLNGNSGLIIYRGQDFDGTNGYQTPRVEWIEDSSNWTGWFHIRLTNRDGSEVYYDHHILDDDSIDGVGPIDVNVVQSVSYANAQITKNKISVLLNYSSPLGLDTNNNLTLLYDENTLGVDAGGSLLVHLKDLGGLHTDSGGIYIGVDGSTVKINASNNLYVPWEDLNLTKDVKLYVYSLYRDYDPNPDANGDPQTDFKFIIGVDANNQDIEDTLGAQIRQSVNAVNYLIFMGGQVQVPDSVQNETTYKNDYYYNSATQCYRFRYKIPAGTIMVILYWEPM